MNRKKQDTAHHRYKINFDINDMKSFKRSKPNLGWSYLIFILKCGTTCPALHFHHGGTTLFIKQLDEHLSIKKWVKLYLHFLVSKGRCDIYRLVI